MKKFCLFLFLIFPVVALFSQSHENLRLVGIFSMKGDDLRTVVTSKNSLVKMSDKEIVEITKIINERIEEYLTLRERVNKSIPVDVNGRPAGKADPQLIRARDAVVYDVSTSIYEYLGEKKYKQLDKTLMNENERKNSEGLKNAMKNKKK